jgi:hypothetical protein
MNKLVQAVTLITCILVVPISNLSRNTIQSEIFHTYSAPSHTNVRIGEFVLRIN